MKFSEKCEPADVIAFLVLVASFFLMYNHINGIVTGIATMVVTYYFVRKSPRDNTKT